MSEKAKRRGEILIHAAFIGLIILLCYVALKNLYLFLPLIIGFFLVAILNPLVRLIHSKLSKIDQRIISVILIAFFYIVLIGFLTFVTIELIIALQGLFTQLPDYYADTIVPTFENLGEFFNGFLDRIPPEWMATYTSIQETVMESLAAGVTSISTSGVAFLTRFIQQVPNFLIALVFTVLLSFFISFQYKDLVETFKRIAPKAVSTRVTEVANLLKKTVFEYSKAIFKLMFITFIELTIGFFIIGIENPVGTAAAIAIFDALPVFGTGGIMIPWIILELLQANYSLALSLTVLYVIITVIRNVIEPKIVGDQLELNPIISLTSIYLGFRLFGFIGMIAFPILTSIVFALYETGFFRIKPQEDDNLFVPAAEGPLDQTDSSGNEDAEKAEQKPESTSLTRR